MYFSSKIEKESQEWLKANFPNEYWTAEFNMGWAMSHRPLWILMEILETALSFIVVGGIIFLFSKSIPMAVFGGAFIPLILETIYIFMKK